MIDNREEETVREVSFWVNSDSPVSEKYVWQRLRSLPRRQESVSFAWERFVYDTNLPRNPIIRLGGQLPFSSCQREGYCQRQMDVEWATRVAYNSARVAYMYINRHSPKNKSFLLFLCIYRQVPDNGNRYKSYCSTYIYI